MLFSIALICLCGLLAEALFRKLHLPHIIGMLLVGVILGPFCLNGLDESLLALAPDIKKIALIIILLKAGLTLDIHDLKMVGRPAILLSFLPAVFEAAAFLFFAPHFLGITVLEAGIIGVVLGAVSPAVVITRMAKMMEEGYGTKQGIPQMIIAGCSASDVIVIVVFSALLTMDTGESISAVSFLQIPESILFGILLGVISGYIMIWFFKRVHIRDTIKVIVMISVSLFFVVLEEMLDGIVAVSGLLAVMSMGIVIYNMYDVLAKRVTIKFGKIWVAAEIFLFVLVGATVNLPYAASAGIVVVILLFAGLLFRMAGSWLSLLGTKLNRKEKGFCLLTQIPKATVQAAIGGIPLAMGLACGNLVQTVAVISILITAPLGALLIDASYKKWLTKTE